MQLYARTCMNLFCQTKLVNIYLNTQPIKLRALFFNTNNLFSIFNLETIYNQNEVIIHRLIEKLICRCCNDLPLIFNHTFFEINKLSQVFFVGFFTTAMIIKIFQHRPSHFYSLRKASS